MTFRACSCDQLLNYSLIKVLGVRAASHDSRSRLSVEEREQV